MNYQYYFKQSRFKDIWKVLHYVYNEPIETQSLYEELVKEIQLLSIQNQFPCEAINISLDEFNDIFVGGAPDPQEWLVGREVIVDIPNAEVSIAEVAAHLLYWSTLYAIRTQTAQRNDFSQWFQESMAGPRYDGETGLMPNLSLQPILHFCYHFQVPKYIALTQCLFLFKIGGNLKICSKYFSCLRNTEINSSIHQNKIS